MESHHLKCSLLSASLLSLCLASASAQVCHDPASNCNASNTCPPSSVCQIVITHTGNQAIASVNGNPAQYVCVYYGQAVQWIEGEYNADFTVQFLATPFTDSDYFFQGYWTVADWGTIQNPTTDHCYKYSIVQQVGPNLATADPKVIVQGMLGANVQKK